MRRRRRTLELDDPMTVDAPALSLDESPHTPAVGPAATHTRVTVIAPSRRWPSLDSRELWEYRGLLAFLVWRDIKVRYAQTVMGASWAIIQPLLTMVVFTVIFGNFAKVPSDGVPYPVFSLAALVPWTFFATTFAGAAASLVTNSNLLTKVYFPRLIIPFAQVIAGLLDLVIAMVILLITMAWYHITPSPMALIIIPILTVSMMLTSAGIGSWLAALNIQYRDVKYVTPFLVQVWMYASPVVYPMSLVPAKWRVLYALNPMAGVIEGFRAALLGSSPISWSLIGFSLGVGMVACLAGIVYFRSVNRVFADVA